MIGSRTKLYKYIFRILSIILLGILLPFIYRSLNIIIKFKTHHGLKEGTFGYPLDLKTLIFNAIIFLFSALIIFISFFNKRISWFFAQIFSISWSIIIILNEIVKITTCIEYLNIYYFIIQILLVFYLIIINHKEIKRYYFNEMFNNKKYLYIIIGAILMLILWFLAYI